MDPRLYSNEELITTARLHGDPLVLELGSRFTKAADELADANEEIEAHEDELGKAAEESFERHQSLREELEDRLQDQIDKRDEQLARETRRVEEFHWENQQFRTVIERLKSELKDRSEKKDRPMLEQQIEKLTERVAAVEVGQARTNELLVDILNAIREPKAPQPDAEEPKAQKPKAPSKPAPVKEPEPDSDDEVVTEEDAKSVLITLAKVYGREAALDVLGQFDAKKIGSVKPEDYAALLEACANYEQKDAA